MLVKQSPPIMYTRRCVDPEGGGAAGVPDTHPGISHVNVGSLKSLVRTPLPQEAI